MEKQTLPTLNKAQLIGTSILTLLGLSNLVNDVFDGLITWYSFMGDIVGIYDLACGQIIAWLFGWWLWFEFPRWIFDTLVVIACLSLALRIYQAGDESKDKPIGLFGFVFIVLYMQLLAPDSDETKSLILRYLKYLAYVVGGFVILLFINWQLLARFS